MAGARVEAVRLVEVLRSVEAQVLGGEQLAASGAGSRWVGGALVARLTQVKLVMVG